MNLIFKNLQIKISVNVTKLFLRRYLNYLSTVIEDILPIVNAIHI